jgi:hypothetical protein
VALQPAQAAARAPQLDVGVAKQQNVSMPYGFDIAGAGDLLPPDQAGVFGKEDRS